MAFPLSILFEPVAMDRIRQNLTVLAGMPFVIAGADGTVLSADWQNESADDLRVRETAVSALFADPVNTGRLQEKRAGIYESPAGPAFAVVPVAIDDILFGFLVSIPFLLMKAGEEEREKSGHPAGEFKFIDESRVEECLSQLSAAAGVLAEICRPLADNQKTGEELGFIRELFSIQQESSPDGILVVDDAGTIVSSNRRFQEIWGIPDAVMEKKSDREVLGYVENKLAEPRAFILKIKSINENRDETSRDELLMKDGRVLDRYSAPLSNAAGDYLGRIWYFRDITLRKQAQAALVEEKDRFRSTLDNLLEGCQIIGYDLRYLYVNDAVARHGHTTCEALLGKTMMEAYPGIEKTVMFSRLKECMEKRISDQMENRFDFPNGSEGWFELRFEPVPEGVFILSEDITGRKKADEVLHAMNARLEAMNKELLANNEELTRKEQELQQSEEKLRLKLDWVLSPDTDAGEFELGNILDLPEIRLMMEDFTSLTGMVTAILDIKGEILVATGWQDICTKFHRVNPETASFCTESDLFLAENIKAGEYVAYKCKNKLWDVVTPLNIAGKHVGNIYTGQFFYDDEVVDEAVFIKQADRYGFDREEYLAALRRVPRFSRERVRHLMDFLVKFTDFISKLSYSNLKLARTMVEQSRTEDALRKSEQRYRSLYEGVPAGLCRIAASGEVLTANPAFAHLLGFEDTGELSVINAFTLFADPDVLRDWQERMEREGAVQNFEVRLKQRDGSVIIVQNNGRAVQDETGLVRYYEGSFEDITDRKHAEEALVESETRYRTLFESATIAIVQMDGDRFSECNAQALLLFGCREKSELIGRSILDFSPVYQNEEMRSEDMIQEYLAGVMEGMPQRFSWKCLSLNRQPFDTDVTLNCVIAGKRSYLLTFLFDVTDFLAASKKLEELMEQLAILNDQIRNPLQYIIMTASFEEGGVGEKLMPAIRQINDIITRLDQGWLKSQKVHEMLQRHYGMFKGP